MKEKVIIVGAGMAGCFMALCLAKRGFTVEVYEYRPDVRKHPYDSGRSFNLTLYYRGILAMKKAGLWDKIKDVAILAQGNVAHYLNKKESFNPFDTRGDEVLYTVHRNKLNGALLNEIEKLPQVSIFFNVRCVGIDREGKNVLFQKTDGKKERFSTQADIVVGADGVNSIVRSEMQKGQTASFTKEHEDWGYKEVHITPELAKKLNLRQKATHTWPRDDSLLIAFPNPDDSFTLMFNLPLSGENSFTSLSSEEAIHTYITNHFPDLAPLLPEITNSFLHKPTGDFTTIRTAPWYHKDFMVLVGDSAHGVIPFYGQGVCAAFEDCLVLSELIDKNRGGFAKAFAKYQGMRKKNTDILADLSKENFFELRDKSRSPFYILKEKTDTFLNRLFPKFWLPPLYILVAHTTIDYDDAVRLHKRQQKISKLIGLDLLLGILAVPVSILRSPKLFIRQSGA